MKNLRRELPLMIVPVLALAGVGYVMRHRKEAVLVPPEPFRLTLDKIHFAPVTPHEASEGYDTKVVVDLGHRGTAPPWWGKQTGYSGTTSGPWQLLARQGDGSTIASDAKGVPVQNFRWQAAYDKDKDIYSARYLMNLRQIPPGGELRLQDRLGVENSSGPTKLLCAPVWVDTIARQKGQSTVLPQVSHDTGLKVERIEFGAAPPTVTQNGAPQWRARFLVRSIGPDSDGRGASLNLQVVDAHGDPVINTYTSSSSGGPWGDISPAAGASHLTTAGYSFGLDTKHLSSTTPLRLKGTIYSGDHWPLSIDLPLRDTHGQILLTPHPAPAFRVTSALKSVPNLSDAKANGTDTLVTATLQAIGAPATPLEQWEWETSYSSYVVDAHGKRYWTFPFKGGTNTAFSSFNMSHAGTAASYFIIYSLNLSAIPASAGALTFHATISANGSQRVPVSVRVR